MTTTPYSYLKSDPDWFGPFRYCFQSFTEYYIGNKGLQDDLELTLAKVHFIVVVDDKIHLFEKNFDGQMDSQKLKGKTVEWIWTEMSKSRWKTYDKYMSFTLHLFIKTKSDHFFFRATHNSFGSQNMNNEVRKDLLKKVFFEFKEDGFVNGIFGEGYTCGPFSGDGYESSIKTIGIRPVHLNSGESHESGECSCVLQ